MLSLLEMSAYGGVMILAVILVRALAMNRLPKAVFLALWALTLARLALPVSLPSPASIWAAAGRLPAVVAEEIRLAKAAGMDDELAAFSKVAAAPQDEVQAPPAVPTDEEIHGIDVLDLELAVRCLWKENIYAEAAMGCTGPVVKLAGSSLDKARAVLTASGYL